MGLDMYARVTRTKPNQPVDFTVPNDEFKGEPAFRFLSADGPLDELHYWRKHPDLHGWMESLYREKGGTDDGFNCVNLQLDEGDLLKLEQAVKERMLPPTTGFFFGESDGEEEADDLEFIRKAREAIAAGLTVYYRAWY
jgi:hypothetical protein